MTLPLSKEVVLTWQHKPAFTTRGMKRGDHLCFDSKTEVLDTLSYKNKIPPTFCLNAVNQTRKPLPVKR